MRSRGADGLKLLVPGLRIPAAGLNTVMNTVMNTVTPAF
jgi:hypothetical protein